MGPRGCGLLRRKLRGESGVRRRSQGEEEKVSDLLNMEEEDIKSKAHSLWIQRAISDRIKAQLKSMMDEIAAEVEKEVQRILSDDEERTDSSGSGKGEEKKRNRTMLYSPNWEELETKVSKVVLEGVKGMIKRETVQTQKSKEEEERSKIRILDLITNYEKGFGLFFQDKFEEAHSLWKEVEKGMKSELG